MKPTLQLKLGQQLAMTPQLQQAIRLLQLSSLELQQEIQDALDSNPLLEVEEDSQETSTTPEDANKTQDENSIEESSATAEATSEPEQIDSADALEKNDIGDDLPIDTTWEDVYSANTGSTGISIDDEMPIYQGETTQSLQDYLMWQVHLTPFSDIDLSIAIAIVDAIDDNGYLTISADDILESMGSEEVELDEVEVVIKRVQQFDPLSVGSRSLKECLLLQLVTYPPDTPWLTETQSIIKHHIALLGNRDYRQLAKETKLKEAELKHVMSLIHSLDPRPGNNIAHGDTEYVIPDVTVVKDNGKWVVNINPDSAPKLKVNAQYAALGKSTRNSADGHFIKTNLQEAKWLIKSLESRNETLLKVARCIVEQQQAFFELGEEAMKPMVLNDIALAVEMHESTISRVTTQKFMHTPRGIFGLKYFFSSHVSTDNGGECSSTAIRALVKKLVSAENQAKPLSDSKITALLAEQGIMVARRTIAKYRESLGIPPSNQRKQLL
ncbi:MAG: RNA polymerase factor sigma-54 [Aliivibrio sp.]|uniref:RNA polymerase factor sigma-54 n=1 Tax=Aliivibrio sp. TaxID=1872443 RepID=UPI001A37C637|nr:RNA polymerase factor sigma-54 [Aliivibrio sp.]